MWKRYLNPFLLVKYFAIYLIVHSMKVSKKEAEKAQRHKIIQIMSSLNET